MREFRTVSLTFVVFLATGLPASAAGFGHVGQVPDMGGQAGAANAGTSAGAGIYAAPSVGGMVNNASINAPGGAASIGGSFSSVASVGGVTTQTNVDASKNISASTNVSVTETIDGMNPAYGLSGAGVMGAIDDAQNFAAGVGASNAPDPNAIIQAVTAEQDFLNSQGN